MAASFSEVGSASSTESSLFGICSASQCSLLETLLELAVCLLAISCPKEGQRLNACEFGLFETKDDQDDILDTIHEFHAMRNRLLSVLATQIILVGGTWSPTPLHIYHRGVDIWTQSQAATFRIVRTPIKRAFFLSGQGTSFCHVEALRGQSIKERSEAIEHYALPQRQPA